MSAAPLDHVGSPLTRLQSTGCWIDRISRFSSGCVASLVLSFATLGAEPIEGVRVGAAAVEYEAHDSMIIAGGIHEAFVQGAEGKLRASAVVFEKLPFGKFAIVSNDVLMMARADLDPLLVEIEKKTGIAPERVLIHCTHTHHAPSTLRLHGYGAVQRFVANVQQAIVKAVVDADRSLSTDECTFLFHLGHEETVGENSRKLLADGEIYWIGPRTNFVRSTGPFDPDLPVLAFRERAGAFRAVLFNHSTHTIGARTPGVRSPGFYGLAAQELEAVHGGIFLFLEGASGSTHNLTLSGAEATDRIKGAVTASLAALAPVSVRRVAAIRRRFTFRVRQFDEAAEEAAVGRYCKRYAPQHADAIAGVFRNMRKSLAASQGEEKETWLQVLQIGDVVIAAVPAEYFTQLGIDIKTRSPFPNTFVAELANDWIGYLPDRESHKLGGYQVWTGFHSYAEPGTGERIADEIVGMLSELAAANK